MKSKPRKAKAPPLTLKTGNAIDGWVEHEGRARFYAGDRALFEIVPRERGIEITGIDINEIAIRPSHANCVFIDDAERPTKSVAAATAEEEPADPGEKKYIVRGVGAKYGGLCVACGQPTGNRPWDLAELVLLQEPEDKQLAAKAREQGRKAPTPDHAVAHARCVGISINSRGKVRGELPASVMVKSRE